MDNYTRRTRYSIVHARSKPLHSFEARRMKVCQVATKANLWARDLSLAKTINSRLERFMPWPARKLTKWS